MSAPVHRLKTSASTAQRDAGVGPGLCGRSGPATDFAPSVTCNACKREQRFAMRIITSITVDAVTVELPPPEPQPLLEVRRAHELDERLRAIVERSLTGDDESGRRWSWPSAAVAISALVAFRVDGQPVRSTTAPSRFAREPIGKSDPARAVTGLVDRLAAVADALDAAYTAPRCWPGSIDENGEPRAAVTLSATLQRAILERSIAGSRGFQGQAHAAVAEWVEQEHGIDLTERQVALVRAEGVRAVAEHLRTVGELEPAEEDRHVREEEDAMRLPGCDVTGWEAIAEIVGLSESVCQRLERADDRLPVRRMPGVRGVGARRAELEAWAARQTSHDVARADRVAG